MRRGLAPAFRWVLGVALLTVAIAANSSAQPGRRTLGLALGGGSARGFAHLGVLRWLEAHHVPVDAIAGTSMGGLVGGGYAAGMSVAELQQLIGRTDWDDIFGVTAYRNKSMRRKADARDYPSRIEYHVGHGFAFPSALNNGEGIELFLARIAGEYGGLASFDSLPTPFRCVALDLRSGQPVVLDRGSLSTAMRATMSLPGIFPPVKVGEQLLVDGGAMDNVPADVARAMGVDAVVAVDVSAETDSIRAQVSLFAVGLSVLQALQNANTLRGIATADVVIRPDLHDFSGLDWRRADEMIVAGYAAAERMRDKLLPFAVDEETWDVYQASRATRRATPPRITTIRITGMTPNDSQLIARMLRGQIGLEIDVGAVEQAIREVGRLGSYQSIAWEVHRAGSTGELEVHAKGHRAWPILMSSVNTESRRTNDYVYQLAARTLRYDVPAPGDELRLDGALGTNPRVAAELVHMLTAPHRATFFVAGGGAWSMYSFNAAANDAFVAQYTQKLIFAQSDLGLESANVEVRAGARSGHVSGSVDTGNPALPSLSGNVAEIRLRGTFDTQNSATIPSEGLRLVALGRHVLEYPDPSRSLDRRTNHNLWQAELTGSRVWSWRRRQERFFIAGSGGSSFGNTPLLTDQFMLGIPFRLDAFTIGERRDDDYGVLTAGYLHVLAELPGFLGGAIMAGAWGETGSAWNSGTNPSVVGQGTVAAIIETLVGPAAVRYSIGGGSRRFAFGVGRLF